MSAETHQETHTFQTEVKQLLHLMIHSLYSNREIFLRELVSNASDAADKLRFEAISRPELLDATPDLAVRVSYDADAGTVSVSDNGIGMSRDEAVANLGTIARSGTSEFLASLTGDAKADARLIGQFGVGFYSSFIVADRVEVFTRRADLPAADGVHWTSGADGEFTVANADRPERGTTVVLHLKEDAREFANGWRLRQLVRRYSDHISFPVLMPVESQGDSDSEAADDDSPPEERVNTASALWTRPKAEVADEEYGEFYKHVAHDFEDPLAWSHNRVEGKREYTSLLYLPRRAPFDLWNRESPRGLKLYVQRVFIMDDAEQFLPLYLRFVRGVVDSSDLPLNVSREILQSDASVAAMRSALTRRALDLVGTLASDRPDDYAAFWKEFGAVLKEGPAEDPGNAERIAALLRFSTTRGDSDSQDRTLDQYIEDMPEGQERIYYLVGESWNAVRRSPHLEALREKGVEVLLLHDRIDEWLMSHLREYREKAFADITRGELDLGGLGGDEDAASTPESPELVERLKSLYGERVADVRGSRRLTDSPACLVAAEDDPGMQMRRILEAAGQAVPPSNPTLEINAGHPLVRRLEAAEGDRFADLAWVMLDQASLSAGGELVDPGAYVERVNRLLLELTA